MEIYFGNPVRLFHKQASPGSPTTGQDPAYISCSLHQPITRNHQDAVILLHGLGGTRHEHNGNFIRLAAQLAQDGFLVLRLDFRGCGESSGSPGSFTISSMIEDALLACAYLREAHQVKNIHLLGFSLGGTIATLAATDLLQQDAEMLASLCLWQTSLDILQDLKRIFGPLALTKIRPRKSLANIQLGLISLNSQFAEELKDLQESLDQALELISRQRPLLIVRSEKDEVVSQNPRLWQEIENGSAAFQKIERLVIKDADHGLSCEAHLLEAVNQTREFLKKTKEA